MLRCAFAALLCAALAQAGGHAGGQHGHGGGYGGAQPAVQQAAPTNSYSAPAAVQQAPAATGYSQQAAQPAPVAQSYGAQAPAPAPVADSYGAAPAVQQAPAATGYGPAPAVQQAPAATGYGQPAPQPEPVAQSYGAQAPAPAPVADSYGPAPAVQQAPAATGYGPAPAVQQAPAATGYGPAPAVQQAPAATGYGSAPAPAPVADSYGPAPAVQQAPAATGYGPAPAVQQAPAATGYGAAPAAPAAPVSTGYAQQAPATHSSGYGQQTVARPAAGGYGGAQPAVRPQAPASGYGAAQPTSHSNNGYGSTGAAPSVRPSQPGSVIAAPSIRPEAPGTDDTTAVVVGNDVESCSADTSSYEVRDQMAIADAVMFNRETGLSCSECIAKCDAFSASLPWACKSVTFDHQWQICDMFAVTPLDANAAVGGGNGAGHGGGYGSPPAIRPQQPAAGGYGHSAPVAPTSSGYGAAGNAPAIRPQQPAAGGYGNPAPAPQHNSGYGSAAPAVRPQQPAAGGYGNPAPAPQHNSGYGSAAPAVRPQQPAAGGYGNAPTAPPAGGYGGNQGGAMAPGIRPQAPGASGDASAASGPGRLAPHPDRTAFIRTAAGSSNGTSGSSGAGGDANVCPNAGDINVYSRVQNYVITQVDYGMQHIVTPAVNSGEECAQACSTEELPFMCAGATWNIDTKECKLVEQGIDITESTATFELDDSSDYWYYVRMCTDASFLNSMDDNTIGELVPNMVLVGVSDSVMEADSLEECMKHCFDDTEIGGQGCQSGLFYPEASSEKCILLGDNRFSEGRSSSFGPESTFRQPMFYFGNLVGAPDDEAASLRLARDEPSTVTKSRYSAWSKCETGTRYQYRYQNCGEKNELNCPRQVKLCPVSACEPELNVCKAVCNWSGEKRCPHGRMLQENGKQKYCSEPTDC